MTWYRQSLFFSDTDNNTSTNCSPKCITDPYMGVGINHFIVTFRSGSFQQFSDIFGFIWRIYLDLSGSFWMYLDLSGRRCFQNAVKRNVVASSVDPVWANPLTDDTVVGNNKVNQKCKLKQ